MKPFLSYPGSKDASGAAERILSHLPDHSVYVETHLGGGAIMRRKPPALRSIGIDLDGDVIARWRALNRPGLELVHGCATAWLREHGPHLPADALVYADPPYVQATRTKKRLYRCEMSDRQHEELLDALLALPCSVIVSGYHSDLYAARLAGWRTDSFDVMTRGGVRTEWLWMRTSIAGFADGAGAPGRDFRERERIKRKVTRWRANFASMPKVERDAVLRALIAEYGDRAGNIVTAGGVESGRPRCE